MKTDLSKFLYRITFIVVVALSFVFSNNTAYAASIGDVITFGEYEQDNDLSNGKEPIEWIVLDVDGDKALITSKYVLDCVDYNDNSLNKLQEITWESCSLRKWLNEDFYYTAFSREDQIKIVETLNTNDGNIYYDTEGCSDTWDKVFLLSIEEIKKYFSINAWIDELKSGYSQELITDATPYAIEHKASVSKFASGDYYSFFAKRGYSPDVIGKNGSYWYTRTVGRDEKSVCYVQPDGGVGYKINTNLFMILGVRPTLYVKGMDSQSLGENLNETEEQSNGSNEKTYISEDDCKNVPEGYVMLFRFYNPNNSEHFYTGSIREGNTLIDAGWIWEGEGWIAPEEGTPVYRLYNPNAGDHHYTTSEKERTNLIEAGWNDEGIAWRTTSEGKALYRLYNPNAVSGAHHYTQSEKERDNLVNIGWQYEGIGWYGL